MDLSILTAPLDWAQLITLLTTSLIVVLALFSLIYGFARLINNAGIVDVLWGFGFTAIAVINWQMADGLMLRKTLMAVMVTLASLRLGYYLLQRFLKEHPEEDARYSNIREIWQDEGKPAELLMYGLFLIQAVLMWLISIPFAVAMINPAPEVIWLEWLAVGVFIIGWTGEALADYQLDQFKSNADNKGKTCKIGLWRYSRHPNYFFEWVMWCAYYLFALASPWGWATIFSPLLMLVFLTKVTGVQATEEHAMKSRSDYAEYQRTTSPFIPWFNKSFPQEDNETKQTLPSALT